MLFFINQHYIQYSNCGRKILKYIIDLFEAPLIDLIGCNGLIKNEVENFKSHSCDYPKEPFKMKLVSFCQNFHNNKLKITRCIGIVFTKNIRKSNEL